MLEKSLFQKIKEAGSHTIIYGIGSALQSALNFLLIPLYTRKLTPEMYGIYSLIIVCGSLAGVVFYFGASSALARSFYDYNDFEERRKVVSTSFYITIAGAILQCSIGFGMGNAISLFLFKSSAYHLHIALALVGSALTFINTLFFMLLRFDRLSRQVVIINVASVILSSILIAWFLVELKLGVMAPILGGVITQLSVGIALFWLVRKYIVLGYSAEELKLQIPFGFQQIVIGVACYAFDWLNRYFINKYTTLSDVGIYSLGYQIGMAINILLIFPFCQIWAPMRMQYRNDTNADEFYKKMLTYYVLLGIAFTSIISVFSREILVLVAGKKEYIESCRVVPFVMLGMMIYGTINIIDNGIYFSRKVIYHVYIFWTALLLSCILNYLVVPRFGYIGASVVILIYYCIVVCLVSFVSNRLYKIHYEGKRLAALLVLGVLTIAAGELITSPVIAAVLAMKSFLICLMFIAIYALVLTIEEKNKLWEIIGGLRRETA